jgi:hypothetical protein
VASGSNLHQRPERVDYDLFLESQPRSWPNFWRFGSALVTAGREKARDIHHLGLLCPDRNRVDYPAFGVKGSPA